jgi:hypothetical protein
MKRIVRKELGHSRHTIRKKMTDKSRLIALIGFCR